MLNNNIYYHRTTIAGLLAFGRLFNNLHIIRKDPTDSTDQWAQTLKIPIDLSNKEKWLRRIDEEPELEKQKGIVFPRMAYEPTGFAYDPTRKTTRMERIRSQPSEDERFHEFSPVPWNMDVSLYIGTRNFEDNLQIVEQILPYFTPEFTLAVEVIPEMEIVKNIPIILNGWSFQDDFEGDFSSRRQITSTLSFTLKLDLFGPVRSQGVIKELDIFLPNQAIVYHAEQEEKDGPILNEGWNDYDPEE